MSKIKVLKKLNVLETIIAELQNIYNEWLDMFPFDLEIFSHLKEEFANELPALRESYLNYKGNNGEVDIVIDFYSEKTFLRFLAQRTTKLLAEINTLQLLENKRITDFEKHKLDLIIKERRLKLQSQVKWSRLNKPDYMESINEWFKDEKQFVVDITPYIDKYIPNKSEPQKRLPAKYYALYHRILIELKEVSPFKLVNDSEMPAGEIKQYAIDNYGFNDGQSFYRQFSEINTAKKHDIAISFGSGYKQKIIDISQNCAKVIKHLEKYPN